MDSPKYGKQTIDEPFRPPEPLEKYWGNIQNIFSNESLVLKIITMNKDTQSSLEYHAPICNLFCDLTRRLCLYFMEECG